MLLSHLKKTSLRPPNKSLLVLPSEFSASVTSSFDFPEPVKTRCRVFGKLYRWKIHSNGLGSMPWFSTGRPREIFGCSAMNSLPQLESYIMRATIKVFRGSRKSTGQIVSCLEKHWFSAFRPLTDMWDARGRLQVRCAQQRFPDSPRLEVCWKVLRKKRQR